MAHYGVEWLQRPNIHVTEYHYLVDAQESDSAETAEETVLSVGR